MIKTLLVDGNNLLKIGFHGAKTLYYKDVHIGGIYHFINTLRKFIEDYNFDKVIVCWDGEQSASARKLLYPKYKENRKSDFNEEQENSFIYQKNRIKKYLEEVFIRQIEISGNESDDLIAYYCQISEDETKVIFSGDKDLTQLISEKVSVYSPNTKQLYKFGDKIKIYDYEFPHANVKTFKILSGDKSDNIDGIYYLGEKTLVKLFPEILENEVSFTDILKKAEQIFESDKNNNTIKNLLTGKTKTGIYGEEFFSVNQQIVDLSNPLITDEAKEMVENYYKETLDPTDRGYKNLMRMMVEDGLFKYLSNRDDAWINFLKPFLKLTRKEKRNFSNKK